MERRGGASEEPEFHQQVQVEEEDDDDDWVLLGERELDESADEEAPDARDEQGPQRRQAECTDKWSVVFHSEASVAAKRHRQDNCSLFAREHLVPGHHMALSGSDIELIRASWVRARSDPIQAGVLLFKG